MPRTESALEAGSAYRILWGKQTRSGPGSGAVGSDPWSFLLGERRVCSSSDRRNPPWSTRQEHGCARPTGDCCPHARKAIQAAIAGPSRARVPARGRTGVSDAYGKAPTDGRSCSVGTDGACEGSPAMAGTSLIGSGRFRCGTATSDSRPSSSSDGAPGESRPYACSLRNCVQVGPTRRGAGPRRPWRSTVATVVAETSIPSSKKLPPDPEVAPASVLPP